MDNEKKKDPAAVSLGKRGAAKRNENLDKKERSAIAKKAAQARWGKKKPAKKPKAAKKGKA